MRSPVADYNKMRDRLTKRYGDDLSKCNEKLKDVVCGKMALQIIHENINRLISSKQAQK